MHHLASTLLQSHGCTSPWSYYFFSMHCVSFESVHPKIQPAILVIFGNSGSPLEIKIKFSGFDQSVGSQHGFVLTNPLVAQWRFLFTASTTFWTTHLVSGIIRNICHTQCKSSVFVGYIGPVHMQKLDTHSKLVTACQIAPVLVVFRVCLKLRQSTGSDVSHSVVVACITDSSQVWACHNLVISFFFFFFGSVMVYSNEQNIHHTEVDNSADVQIPNKYVV